MTIYIYNCVQNGQRTVTSGSQGVMIRWRKDDGLHGQKRQIVPSLVNTVGKCNYTITNSVQISRLDYKTFGNH